MDSFVEQLCVSPPRICQSIRVSVQSQFTDCTFDNSKSVGVGLWGKPGCCITKRMLAVFLCESLEATIFKMSQCARMCAFSHPLAENYHKYFS